MDIDKVTRFEVVDNKGRAYVKYGVQELKLSLQDDGKTLKAFVRFEEEEEISID
jgi:phosphopantetheinyl transferase (holo-ACP synthase)